MVIAIDFDGTCVTHDFPNVGQDIGAAEVLRRLVAKRHKLVLFTMRSNHEIEDPIYPEMPDKKYLTHAVRWFKKNGIPLYGIQSNPTQRLWTSSPKAYAELYIDDAGLGTPLKIDTDLSSRSFVDWLQVEKMLEDLGLI